MIMWDYINEQNELQQSEGTEQIDEVEPIKKLTIINLLYKLFISLNTSLDPELNKIALLINNVLKFSDSLSYQTLQAFLKKIVEYITEIQAKLRKENEKTR